jgi:putative membrane protein
MKRRVAKLILAFGLWIGVNIGAASSAAAQTESRAPSPETAPDVRGTSTENASSRDAAGTGANAPGFTARNVAASPARSTGAGTEIDERDRQFVATAFEHGLAQLYLGELAKTRAAAEQIKAVGVVLSSTQAEENRKLLRLAARKGITLPRGEGAMQKEITAKLEKLSGPKFEKQLMEEIININQRAVANYELASGTHDPDIKIFIEQGLPLAKEKLLFTNKMTGTARRSDKQPGFRGDVSALPE